jgi:hypothetical protein
MAAVSQDVMVEPLVRANTKLTVAEHQRLTIHRYDRLLSLIEGSGVYLMPVLQGWTVDDYVQHLHLYGDRLTENAWVGVGSVGVASLPIVRLLRLKRSLREQAYSIQEIYCALSSKFLTWIESNLRCRPKIKN